jgi:hypothetical protein
MVTCGCRSTNGGAGHEVTALYELTARGARGAGREARGEGRDGRRAEFVGLIEQARGLIEPAHDAVALAPPR